MTIDTQLTNYNAWQEYEILKSLHFDHQVKNHSMHDSMFELNKISRLRINTDDEETLIHLFYEQLTSESHRLMLDILHLIGRYGSVLEWQISEYLSKNPIFYGTHQRNIKRIVKLMIRLNLVERLAFKVSKNTDIERVVETNAYVLTEWGRKILEHEDRETSLNFPPAMNSIKKYDDLIKAWQIYDVDNLLRDKSYFIDGRAEFNQDDREIYYHCWLKSPRKNEIYEIIVFLPLTLNLLNAAHPKTGYDDQQMQHVLKRHNAHFNGLIDLPNNYKTYNLKQYAFVRLSLMPKDIVNLIDNAKAYASDGILGYLLGAVYDNSASHHDVNNSSGIEHSFFYVINNKLYSLRLGD